MSQKEVMAVCRNPECGAYLPLSSKRFQTCTKCCRVTCTECKANHEGKTCNAYAASQKGENRTLLAPLQATAHQGLPRKEEAPLVRSPRGISQQEASPKYPADMKFPEEDTRTPRRNDEKVSLENTILEGGLEIIAYCRLKDCSGVAVIAREDTLFPCPICKHFTCMRCSAIHESMTCEEYVAKKDVSPNFMDQIADEKTSISPASSLPSVGEEEDDSGGVIVNCRHGTCEGRGYVEKSATLAQCLACKHWTCRRCKTSHDGMTCAQYKNIEDEHTADFADHETQDVVTENGNTVLCINPKCGSLVQLDIAIGQVRCPNMCDGLCYVCPDCKVFTCITCAAKQDQKGIFETFKDMIFKKDSMPKPVSKIYQGAVPKRKKDVRAAENRSSNNDTGILSYRKCRNTYCVKYGDTHPGPCRQRNESQCDKGFKAPERRPCDEEACDLCCQRKHAMTIEACEHRLCSTCIDAVVKNSYLHVIICPVEQSSGRCSGFLSKDEIKKNVSRQTYSKYKEMLTWETMKCQNQKCHAEFCVDKSKESVKCPLCKVDNCIICRVCHRGKTCEEYVRWLVMAMDKGLLEDPAEKEKRFREQEQLYDKNCVPNAEEFDCVVCFGEVEPGGGLILKNCHHSICKDCLTNTVVNSETADVQCPCLAEDGVPCTMNILDDEIKAILSPAGYDAFLEKGLIEAERKAANSFHCKTVNCRGWCIYDIEVNTFDCPVCNMANCLRCEAIHPNITCEVYQADLKRRAQNDADAKASMKFLEDQLEQGAAMRCPTCKVIVIKRSGCDFIMCASCKTGLCWATKGARWGPKGAGDNSGGCRCMVNGVKCHPTCSTCH